MINKERFPALRTQRMQRKKRRFYARLRNCNARSKTRLAREMERSNLTQAHITWQIPAMSLATSCVRCVKPRVVCVACVRLETALNSAAHYPIVLKFGTLVRYEPRN